jgi:hypothetical protein
VKRSWISMGLVLVLPLIAIILTVCFLETDALHFLRTVYVMPALKQANCTSIHCQAYPMLITSLISARLDLRPRVFRPCAVSNVQSSDRRRPRCEFTTVRLTNVGIDATNGYSIG